ncbi:MAG TPA: hypothetical protein VGO63_02885 [Candidatus Paceibacterota bacterium]|jgi:hypothetical protein|nr:hypothetical protein [Candidatus Paceibacterota bacterium]
MENPQIDKSTQEKIEQAKALLKDPDSAKPNIWESFSDLLQTYQHFLDLKEKTDEEPPEIAILRETLDALTDTHFAFAKAYFDHNSRSIDKNEKRYTKLFQRIFQIAKNAPETAEDLFGRLKRIKRKVLKTILVSSFMVVTGLTVNYNMTRFKVRVKLDPQTNEKRYEHDDPQTTHFLNCITGLERLTPEEETGLLRELLLRQIYLETLKAEGIVDKNADDSVINQASRQELINILKKHNAKSSDPIKAVNDDQLVDNTLGIAPYKFDQKYYEAVWTLETETGSAKLVFEYPVIYGKDEFSLGRKKEKSDYNVLENKVHLEPQRNHPEIKRILMAEFSHSKQFNESPVASYLTGIMDEITIFDYIIHIDPTFRGERRSEGHPPGSLIRLLDWSKIYDKNIYKSPGSFFVNIDNDEPFVDDFGNGPRLDYSTVEYAAHGQIEPQLHKRFDQLYPQLKDFEKARQAQIDAEVSAAKMVGQGQLAIAKVEFEAQKKLHDKEIKKIWQNEKLNFEQKKQREAAEDSKLKPCQDKIDNIIMEYKSKGIQL